MCLKNNVGEHFKISRIFGISLDKFERNIQGYIQFDLPIDFFHFFPNIHLDFLILVGLREFDFQELMIFLYFE